ncbi:MAG: arginine repressor [Lachnospiraceae bacterium]|nr:arginine repressor [Lachnospiraceae bacterium]
MKQKRQEAIINLINNNSIETQEELLSLLKAEGFDTTQATVSRDIRELNVTKISYDGNKHKYVVGRITESAGAKSYKHLLGSCIISIDNAENIVVIKTVAGMAMAVAAAIDSLALDDTVGSIAGDDTIFLAIRHSNLADKVIGDIKKCC